MRDTRKLLFFNREKSPLRSIEASSSFIFVVVLGGLLILLGLVLLYRFNVSKELPHPLAAAHEDLSATQQQEPAIPAQESGGGHDTVGYIQRQGIDSQKSQTIESTHSKVTVSYYTKPTVLNVKFLTVFINDVPTEMMFDTGASFITVNNQIMSQLKISSPLVKTVSDTAAGPTASFLFTASSIKIGSIELRNVQCTYQPASAMNLLGGSFLSNFHYSINELDHTITFIPNSENVRITDNNTMEPVSGDGYAEINGKKFIYRGGAFH
jgi:clan AA aspartic protease (TIGR02281 family)